jgi:hypothetical protein
MQGFSQQIAENPGIRFGKCHSLGFKIAAKPKNAL